MDSSSLNLRKTRPTLVTFLFPSAITGLSLSKATSVVYIDLNLYT